MKLSELLKLDVKTLTVVLTIFSTLWGLWLVFPGFSSFTASPAFRIMQEIADEVVWGLAMMFVGMSQVISLIVRQRWYSILSALLALFILSSIGIAIFLTGVKTPALVSFIVFDILATLILILRQMEFTHV